MRKITTGVPQGSVLGSFLFLTNINDLPNASESAKSTLFADDTILYKMEKSTQKVNVDIENVKKWLKQKHTLNNENCESLRIGKTKPISNSIFRNGKMNKPSCKYLGVYIDKNLNFSDHIQNLTKKLNKFCGLIYKVRHMYPRRCSLMFYNAYGK